MDEEGPIYRPSGDGYLINPPSVAFVRVSVETKQLEEEGRSIGLIRKVAGVNTVAIGRSHASIARRRASVAER
jgi:hypothetical protein